MIPQFLKAMHGAIAPRGLVTSKIPLPSVGLVAAASMWAFTKPHGFFFPKIVVLVVGAFLWAIRRNRAGAAFFLVALAATAGSPLPAVGLVGFPGMYQGGLLALAFYLLLMEAPTNLAWLKWAGVGLSAHAVLQRFGFDPFIRAAVLPSGHAIAWNGSHIDLGAVLAMALPVSGPWAPVVVAGLWASEARGAWLGALFAVVPNKIRVLLLPVFLVSFFLTAPKDKARVELWKIAWSGFLDRPWLGYGPEQYQLVLESRRSGLDAVKGPKYSQAHAHHDLLEALCCTGILGLLAYLWLVVPLLRDPSLLALFVVLKFNPVSFEVLCVAALVAANVVQKRRAEQEKKEA